MDRTERFIKINQLLQSRPATPISALTESLSVSRATIVRDLSYMRDRLYAPIVWDKNLRGYRFAESDPDFPQYSLPGIWFNSSELHALLTMEILLRQIQPGVLDPHIQPLYKKVRGLLAHNGDQSIRELLRRVRIIHGSAPHTTPETFHIVVNALLGRFRLHVKYFNQGTKETTPRCVSPQRLVYYHESWYLDCWCHLRKGLRTFRLTNFTKVKITKDKAKDIAEEKLDSELTSGFGIFAGEEIREATLRFAADIAPWVSKEQWHSNQIIELDEHGRLMMTVPYSGDQELIMKILQYGPDVEVLRPQELRAKVKSMLSLTYSMYED